MRPRRPIPSQSCWRIWSARGRRASARPAVRHTCLRAERRRQHQHRARPALGLSGPEALRFTHALRAGHDGILVGVGTVLADDPELRVRLVDGPSPQPVIVDSQLRRRRRPSCWRSPEGRLIAAASTAASSDGRERRAPRAHRGARAPRSSTCRPRCPTAGSILHALLRQLHDDGIEHLMVEGGARIITSFLDARLVDYAASPSRPVSWAGCRRSANRGRPRRRRPVGPAAPLAEPTLAAGSAPPRRRPGARRERSLGPPTGMSLGVVVRGAAPDRPASSRCATSRCRHRRPAGAGATRDVSAMSAGTELLAFRGQLRARPAARRDAGRARAGDLRASVPLRLRVRRARWRRWARAWIRAWIGRRVFGFQPHATMFVAPIAELLRVPEGLTPSGPRCSPHMETAVNLILDGAPALRDDAVLVIGLGIVGLLATALLARFPLALLAAAEPQPHARRLARALAARTRVVDGPGRDHGARSGARGADLVYELSGRSGGAGRWRSPPPGTRRASSSAPGTGTSARRVDLGGRFHRRRLRHRQQPGQPHRRRAVGALGSRAAVRRGLARARRHRHRCRSSATASRSPRPRPPTSSLDQQSGAGVAAGAARLRRWRKDTHDGERAYTVGLLREFVAQHLPRSGATGETRTSALASLPAGGRLRGRHAGPARLPAGHRDGRAAAGRARATAIAASMLNDLPEFAGKNPGIEQFASIIAERLAA